MGRTRCWATAVLLACSARRASAAEVEWQAPEACPDAAELRFRVERAIGMPLSHAAPLRFEVAAAHAAHGFVAHVGMAHGSSASERQRTLSAPDCTQLVELVAVTLALALGENADTASETAAFDGAGAAGGTGSTNAVTDGSVLGASVTPGGGAVALSTAEASSTNPPPPRDAGARPEPEPSEPGPTWSPGIAAWLLGDTGSLPHAGAGVALGVGLKRAGLELRALGTFLFDQHEVLGERADPQPGADLRLGMGALAGCTSPFGSFAAPLAAYVCAGWELGLLSGRGTDVLQPRTGSALWSAPRVDLGARWALGGSGFALDGTLTLAVPLVREDFVLSDLGSVHRPPAAVGRLALGVNWAPW